MGGGGGGCPPPSGAKLLRGALPRIHPPNILTSRPGIWGLSAGTHASGGSPLRAEGGGGGLLPHRTLRSTPPTPHQPPLLRGGGHPSTGHAKVHGSAPCTVRPGAPMAPSGRPTHHPPPTDALCCSTRGVAPPTPPPRPPPLHRAPQEATGAPEIGPRIPPGHRYTIIALQNSTECCLEFAAHSSYRMFLGLPGQLILLPSPPIGGGGDRGPGGRSKGPVRRAVGSSRTAVIRVGRSFRDWIGVAVRAFRAVRGGAVPQARDWGGGGGAQKHRLPRRSTAPKTTFPPVTIQS